MKRFAYLYTMKPEPQKIHRAVRRHVAYWEKLLRNRIEGGPFADFAGGLICFNADDNENAEALVREDPFLQEDLIDQYRIEEWIVTSP
ncbi:MAG: YciI family protein [Planctomycetota bacterium]